MSAKKKSAIFLMSAFFMIVSAMTAFAGSWYQNSDGWYYVMDDGTPGEPEWFSDNGSWYMTGPDGQLMTGWYREFEGSKARRYFFDATGAMQTGWLYDNDNWYFLCPDADDAIHPLGQMLTGWVWVDGYCYYFEPTSGTMKTNWTTDAGRWVDENGRLHNADGELWYETFGYWLTEKPAGSSSSGSGSSSGGSSGSSNRSSSGSGSRSSSRNKSSDDEWADDYNDTSVRSSSNSFTDGNYSLMTSSQRRAVEEAIEDFMDEYIESGMSDFEKEMMIIQYIVENCVYKVGSGTENSTAYSVLINGEAQCSGFADAFLQMAKACGLNVRYVHNDDHAWNLVELDGDWYHVDVTWEASKTAGRYGFGKLRNDYINLEDSEIKQIAYHKTWTPSSIKCNGSKYGPNVVAQYLKTGEVDTSLAVSYEDFLDSAVVSSADDFDENNSSSSSKEYITYTIEFRNPGKYGGMSAVVGTTYGNERISIEYPEGYTYAGLEEGEDFTVTKGSGIFNGDTLMVTSGDSEGKFRININLVEE